MAYECFELSSDGGVAHLQLSRPERRNAMTAAFWKELPQIVRGLDTKVLVLSSTGPHFCGGLDISLFQGSDAFDTNSLEGRQKFRAKLEELQASLSALAEAPFPVIAAVQGGCIGGAVDLVTAADCRYASADAFFCVQEINIGMTADVGTLQRLPRIIPEGIARELAYTGDRMSAGRAKEVGLVNEVFDDHESLVAGVLDIAGRIATKSPLAIWGTKEMCNFTRDHSVADGLRHIALWQSGMFQPADMMESFSAKGEGRTPSFEGLPTRD